MLTIHVLQIQVPWIVPFCGLRQRDDETHQKEAASLGLKEMSSGEEMELPKCLEELAGNEYVFHLLDSLQFHSKSPYVHCVSNQ